MNNLEEQVSKQIQHVVKKTVEEVRGRELNPTKVSVWVLVETKENHTVVHSSEQKT